VLGEDVLPEHLRGVAVELEHGGVELQDVLRPDLGRRRYLGTDDILEVGRHLGGVGELAVPTSDDISAATPPSMIATVIIIFS
jgi:hypothetical protein